MIKIQNPFLLSDKLSDNSKKCLLYTTLLALGISLVIFVPFMIWDKGYFLFFGDFNVQQIPFYKLAHKSVKSGEFLWNWYTDLGANFLGSYNYYMLFSPFFWLTLPFPNEFVPHLMGPLFILKHTCAAIFAFLFIKRFVKDFRFAILGSLLYAFSGFIVFNIFFNQFHESIVFFPLLLIGFEELLTKNRKFVFALAITLNCIINYWMFIGECIFLIVYFLCRITDPKIKISMSKFFMIIFESVLGVMLAAFVLLPSILAICDNTRVGSGHLLSGWNLLLYNHPQRLPAIIQSFFFPPEIPSRPNFLPDNGAKWSSMAGWLPFVSMCGVLSFVLSRKKSWIKTLLITCGIMALVPFLNSLFVLASNGYYCRWFYMPILMMCVASAMAFENPRINLQRGTLWTTILSSLFILPGILNLVPFVQRFWIYVAITGLGLLIFFYIIHKYRKSSLLPSLLLIGVTITSMVYPSIFILYGKQHSDDRDFIINQAINGKQNLNMPNNQFYRIDVYKDIDNMGIFWELPCIQAFHSIVPSSIQRFYPEMGVKRDVASRPPWDKYELRSLLSTKYLFVRKEKASPDLEETFPGLSKYDHQNGYDIYENQNFIPMGFCYDFCVSKKTLSTLDEEDRRKMLIKAICLDEQDFFEYLNILPEYSGDLSSNNFSYEQFQEDVQSRKSITVKDFTIDKKGFSANIDLPNENLVFFSVPYEKGWSATVNKSPAKIVNANIGFMAIKCPPGHSQIRFDYFTPGVINGLRISGVGIVLFLLYFSTVIIYNRKLKSQDPDLDI